MKQWIQNLLQSEQMQKAFEFLKEDDGKTLEQQLELVRIPAYYLQEEEKAKRFKELVEEAGYEAQMDELCNVYTVIPGTGEGANIYISAHLDTVFPPETCLEGKCENGIINIPGIADDTRGCAEILTMLRAIRNAGLKPKGDIIIGANVGEEGLGDLRGIRHFFSTNPLAEKVDGFITVDGAGPLVCYGGTGSHRYEVTFQGPGGHSYSAFGLVNPIHAMGRTIHYLSQIRTPRYPKTTFSVGIVSGGTSVNAIPAECKMRVDMRSDGMQELEKLDAQFHECLERAVREEYERWETERSYEQSGLNRFDRDAHIQVTIEPIGNRPAGNQPKDCPIVEIVSQAYECMGITPDYMSNGSTDANIPISLGIPAICICGGGTAGKYHSLEEWFDPADAYKGAQRNLLALFAMTGLDGVSEPLLPKRK